MRANAKRAVSGTTATILSTTRVFTRMSFLPHSSRGVSVLACYSRGVEERSGGGLRVRCGVAAGRFSLRGRDLRQSRRFDPPLFQEASDPDLVRARLPAPAPPRREERSVALVVERLVQAVDVMVVAQPPAPLGDRLRVQAWKVGCGGGTGQAVRASSRDLTCASGNVTWKVVPAPALRSAQSRP